MRFLAQPRGEPKGQRLAPGGGGGGEFGAPEPDSESKSGTVPVHPTPSHPAIFSRLGTPKSFCKRRLLHAAPSPCSVLLFQVRGQVGEFAGASTSGRKRAWVKAAGRVFLSRRVFLSGGNWTFLVQKKSPFGATMT